MSHTIQRLAGWAPRVFVAVFVITGVWHAPAAGTQPATPVAPGAGRGPGGAAQRGGSPAGQPPGIPPQTARGVYPATAPDDDTGFVSIFDGTSLSGWDGDTTFWRVENGEIVGETTPERVAKTNSFLIWRGGTVRDFELKVEFRINSTNSGIQYRSVELPEVGRWVLKGYQADIEFNGGYTANVHEERGRTGHVVLSRRGQVTRAADGPVFKTLASIADPTLLRGVVTTNGWNQYHIIARGEVLMHIINGQLMSVAIDEDASHAVSEGLLGFQMHTGPPFKVQFRNIRLRTLP
jgi:hypothetical protein